MIGGRLYIEFQCTLILDSSDFYTRESLPTSASIHERLSNATGLAVLASDALSSVAYATQETLLVLLLAGSSSRVRASQSCLTKALENLHHIVIVHRSPFDFLSQATLESCFLVDRIKGNPSYQSEVLRTV